MALNPVTLAATEAMNNVLKGYVAATTYANNERTNREYLDRQLALKADKTPVATMIDEAKRSIDYNALLNIPSTIVHQKYLEMQNIDVLRTHGRYAIKTPSGTLPEGINTTRGIHLDVQAVENMDFKYLQTMIDSQGGKWYRVFRSNLWSGWQSIFTVTHTTTNGLNVDRVSPGVYATTKTKGEWDNLLGRTDTPDVGDASLLDISTAGQRNQLLMLSPGWTYLRTNDTEGTTSASWVNERLLTSYNIDLVYPGLTSLPNVVKPIPEQITNIANQIQTINGTIANLPPTTPSSIELRHDLGRGAYARQYGTKAPVYVNTAGTGIRDTYHPFIKGKVRDTGSYGTAFSFGYTTFQKHRYPTTDSDGFGRGVIELQEDNGRVALWEFEHNGDFVASGDVMTQKGYGLNKFIDGTSYVKNVGSPINNVMTYWDGSEWKLRIDAT